MRFVADIMLGRLAKWLRVLGFDTHYQSFDPIHHIGQMARGGRIPLTRQRKLILFLEGAAFVRCNVPLMPAPEEAARDNIPEYVQTKSDRISGRFQAFSRGKDF